MTAWLKESIVSAGHYLLPECLAQVGSMVGQLQGLNLWLDIANKIGDSEGLSQIKQ